MDKKVDVIAERMVILKKYRDLLRVIRPNVSKENKQFLRKALDLAIEAHKDMRRKSGEPYIYHPLDVAHIVASNIGLGITSIACALLHDVVEDTEYTLEDIRGMFGETAAKTIDGLTKLAGVFDQTTSMQAENFKKMLLTLSDDVRVILIKLADRLHNMRTLDSLSKEKQLKIASETLFLYAPLAHRFGLYEIKNELEDLGVKYIASDIYSSITKKLAATQEARDIYIQKFIEPVKKSLDKSGIKSRIFGRVKSVNSIWDKMKRKEIPFEEVYDLFAIRIIIDTPFEREKSDCWVAYSAVTDLYRPNPDRLRDWVSTPKANGYESLHTTVMGPEGRWVEIQIRTERMDEVAEKGYASHWKYKEAVSGENALDEWLKKLRELLDSPEANAVDFVDDFKLNLFAEEIFVFTPKGELKNMPVGSTTLDFAYGIHTKIGNTCIGAKVNHQVVPLSYHLRSGDQIEILSSQKQKPVEEWLNFVVTAKAKTSIKDALKEERRYLSEQGKNTLEKKLKFLKMEFNQSVVTKLMNYYKFPNPTELFYQIEKGDITLKNLKEFSRDTERGRWLKYLKRTQSVITLGVADKLWHLITTRSASNVLKEDIENFNYSIATCCNPIPGDDVFGFMVESDKIIIHRTNCKEAIQLMSKYGNKIVKAKWNQKESVSFLTGIKITGIDQLGMVNRITKIISSQHNINMRSINLDGHDGTFEGTFMVYVHDTKHLHEMMKNLKSIKGILSVTRIERKKE
ncbi:MAG: bifunctional (p)ppGpp synthetase/guanosine-3',5'-bis(diphosphate) 3'-pyrophosphohydrolase [Bacteroidales bacterium]|nr:bifunctional (p)ppGpp synthetase/guanosine-3',5'-bis(diphosphate) 3'-pyrophosphohydrolase [Bacteroidales bacterium]